MKIWGFLKDFVVVFLRIGMRGCGTEMAANYAYSEQCFQEVNEE